MKKSYTICRVKSADYQLVKFLNEHIPNLNETFGGVYEWDNANWKLIFEKSVFLVAKRNGKINGIHISYKCPHPFDVNITILQQLLFYVKPGCQRAAYHLFNKFIDIGRRESDHIITMLTSHTNVKRSTLERYGFKELETLYRMEV